MVRPVAAAAQPWRRRRRLGRGSIAKFFSTAQPSIVSAAAWIAERMRTYVAHRQMFPLMAELMSSSLGLGVCSSSALGRLLQQRHSRHDLPGLTIAALRHLYPLPCGLDGRGRLARNALDRRDRLTLDTADGGRARPR